MTGRIFDIQRFSLHDGPGIRTTVFLKGCNLRCYWCHNPESVSPQNELQYYPAKCIGCFQCLARCTHGALSAEGGKIAIDRACCVGCGDCAAECCSGALVPVGREASAEEVLGTVLQDRAFYQSSGGGVTFSGGEPMLQPGFLMELLQGCRAQGISTAVETAGNVPGEWFEDIGAYVDLFLFDFKHAEDATHRRGTGVSCALIQRNLEALLERGARVWVRIPVIPGFNADADSMGAMAAYLSGQQGIEKIELMPFHKLGSGKYESLGREYQANDCAPPSQAEMQGFAGIFAAHGLVAQFSGSI